MGLIQARLSKEDEQLILEYTKAKNISVSSLIRSAVIEKIEDEIDLKLYQEAMAEYKDNPKTYTLDEIEQELGLV